jgi:hypothetical protein
MAWTNSKLFRQTIADIIGNNTAFDFDTDAIKAALFNNTTTPDQNVAAASAAYNAGQWVTANEVFQAGQYAQGGVALASKVIDVATSAVVMLDAADVTSGSAATLANVYGALVYDDTLTTPVADQAISFNYFGGAQSVTAGTFTVVWNANGIGRATL